MNTVHIKLDKSVMKSLQPLFDLLEVDVILGLGSGGIMIQPERSSKGAAEGAGTAVYIPGEYGRKIQAIVASLREEENGKKEGGEE